MQQSISTHDQVAAGRKTTSFLVDDRISINVKKGVSQSVAEAATQSFLLTARATDSEVTAEQKFKEWFSALTEKLTELGWRNPQREIPQQAEHPTSLKETYGEQVVAHLVKNLEKTAAKGDRGAIEKAFSAAVAQSDEYAGIDLADPQPEALCRGVAHLFHSDEGNQLALSFAWLQDSQRCAPALDDLPDAKSLLWIVHWRGKLVESSYDAKAVQKLLDGLGNWRKLIVPVPPEDEVTDLPT